MERLKATEQSGKNYLLELEDPEEKKLTKDLLFA
jgi:hypothetical protein